ncbi:hypothetical protein [Methylomicrobium lacus]|uniref:terpene synthase family protein n=1 Tax=Methylomicrobium lacus TaxID=136992 RepID=UPI0035A8BFE4
MINYPRLDCPFPSAINPHADAVNNHTLNWVKQFDLVVDEKNFRRLQKSKFGRLAARAYPNAPLEELKLVSDWNTWLFIRDDQCDESGLGKDPIRLSGVHAELLEILLGRAPEKYDSALAHALYDIRSRLLRKASSAWMSRFVYSVIEYFESSVWEAINRADHKIPDTETYILMRPYTGGLYTDIELIDITEDIYLPLHVRKNEVIQRLSLMANNVVCWSNDIISHAKESKYHDVHNLVATLQPAQPSLQHAIDLAAEMTRAEIDAFVELEKQIPAFSAEIDGDVQRYVAILRSWMRGNLDWAYESSRYIVATDDIALEV